MNSGSNARNKGVLGKGTKTPWLSFTLGYVLLHFGVVSETEI
jgi:hypothetical protein